MTRHVAAIDCGTNSIRLLVADVDAESGEFTELDRRMLQRATIVARHLARRGSETLLTYGLSPLSLFEPGLLRELARTAAETSASLGQMSLR